MVRTRGVKSRRPHTRQHAAVTEQRRPHTRQHAAVTEQQKQFGAKPRSEAATMRTNESIVRMRGGATRGQALHQQIADALQRADNELANEVGVQTRSVALPESTPAPFLAHSEAGLLLAEKLWAPPKPLEQEQKQPDQPDHIGARSEVRKFRNTYTRRHAGEKKKVLGDRHTMMRTNVAGDQQVFEDQNEAAQQQQTHVKHTGVDETCPPYQAHESEQPLLEDRPEQHQAGDQQVIEDQNGAAQQQQRDKDDLNVEPNQSQQQQRDKDHLNVEPNQSQQQQPNQHQAGEVPGDDVDLNVEPNQSQQQQRDKDAVPGNPLWVHKKYTGRHRVLKNISLGLFLGLKKQNSPPSMADDGRTRYRLQRISTMNAATPDRTSNVQCEPSQPALSVESHAQRSESGSSEQPAMRKKKMPRCADPHQTENIGGESHQLDFCVESQAQCFDVGSSSKPTQSKKRKARVVNPDHAGNGDDETAQPDLRVGGKPRSPDGGISEQPGQKKKRGQRGPSKPREPATPGKRPLLYVVGQREFRAVPKCTKIVTTIRLLTCRAMPGPCRSYHQFSVNTRKEILDRFLTIYSWGTDEDVAACIDVFENIASDGYCRELSERRQELTKKFGKNIEEWKLRPPHWCPVPNYWRELCDIWKTKGWQEWSEQSKHNKASVHHVAGSRSTFNHMEILRDQKGGDVSLKDVFDKTHIRKGPEGPVYVNKRAKTVSEIFDWCRQQPQAKGMKDIDVWTDIVGGPINGRIFGSTATSAEDPEYFTAEQTALMMLEALAKQHAMHRAELDAMNETTSKYAILIKDLYDRNGLPLPVIPGRSGRRQDAQAENNNP